MPHIAFERSREAGACADMDALVAAAIREVEEETGIKRVELAIDLGLESKFTGFDGEIYAERALATRVGRHEKAVLSHEHTEIAWVAPEEAARRFHWNENREALARLLRHVGS